MEPSDWIAVGALCVSGIALFTSVLVSIAGFWFNYRTNKENIKARRAEIATEKSIEAYRELVEKMMKVDTYIGEVILEFTNEGLEEQSPELKSRISAYREYLDKCRVYLPETIYQNLREILLGWYAFDEMYNDRDWGEDELNGQWATVRIQLDENVEQIQRLIGIETNE